MTERQFPVPSVQSHSSEADLDQFCREYLQALVNNDLIVSYLINYIIFIIVIFSTKFKVFHWSIRSA